MTPRSARHAVAALALCLVAPMSDAVAQGTTSPQLPTLLALIRSGRADSALRLLPPVANTSRDAETELVRATALRALGRRYAADSAVGRAAVLSPDEGLPSWAPAELLASWRGLRLRMPRAERVGVRQDVAGVQFELLLVARDGSQPRGKAVWWIAHPAGTDTVCIGSSDVSCQWNGSGRDGRVASGMATLGVSVSTLGFEIPVVVSRPLRLTWTAAADIPPPTILPETVEVVGPDNDRRRQWLLGAGAIGGAGALSMALVASQAGRLSVDTPVGSASRSTAAAAYITGGALVLSGAAVAGWSLARSWRRTMRFVRPDIVAANLASRAEWSKATAARGDAKDRLVAEILP